MPQKKKAPAKKADSKRDPKKAPAKKVEAKTNGKKAAPKRAAAPASNKNGKKASKSAPVVAKSGKKEPTKKEAKTSKDLKKNGKLAATEKGAVAAPASTAKTNKKATPKTLSAKEARQAAKSAAEEILDQVLGTETTENESDIVLTNADGKRYCKVAECDELATSDSYCRYHYLLNWKKIQLRKKILAGDKLNRYIEELTARYPDKYLEMIRKDLATDKDFMAALHELEIDEGNDDNEFEDDTRSYIDEVRGVTTGTATAADEDEY